MSEFMFGEEILTVKTLAKYLNVSKITIYKCVKNGALPYFRVGLSGETGPIRFKKSEIDSLIKNITKHGYFEEMVIK